MSTYSSGPSKGDQNQFALLAGLKEALSQGSQHNYVDITGGPKKETVLKALFNAEVEALATIQHVNQTNSMRAFANIADAFHVLSGPNGTGKTENMVRSIWPTVRVGHTSCVTTVTTLTANANTTRIFTARPEDLKHCKVLKIGTNIHEDVMMRKSDRYNEMSEEQLAQPPPEDSSDYDSEDDSELQAVEADLNTLFDEHEKMMEDMNDAEKEVTQNHLGQLAVSFVEQKEARRKAFLDLQKLSTLDRSQNVPLACTLSYHIWELMREDSLRAHANYERELAKLKSQYQGTELLRHVADLDSKFSHDRDRLRRFQDFQKDYRKHKGQLPQASKDEFRRFTEEMAKRVIANASILVTTANNAGGEVAELGFDPTLLWCDEAGQSTMPNFSVPLTVFKNWQAVIVMGDKQRESTIHSQGFNEVYQNAKFSVLAHLLYKGHPHFELVEQYRMDPDVSEFPNKFWYEGSIENGPNTMVKDETKDIMRAMSKGLGIAKKSKKGSIYWLESVFHGVCRHEEGGSSLQNYANADAISDRVKQLIHDGIRPEQITILVYYKSQINVITAKLKTPDGQKLHVKIVTADSFVVGDQDIIVADLVFAKSYLACSQANRDEADASKIFSKVTPYMRDAHRLYIFLTRAKKGLILFCHLPSLLSTTRLDKAKNEKSALAALAKDAIKRNLVFAQTTAIDSHTGTKITSQTDNEKRERERDHAKTIGDIFHNRWNPFPGEAKRTG